MACLQTGMYPKFPVLAYVIEDEEVFSAYAASVRRAYRTLYDEVGRKN